MRKTLSANKRDFLPQSVAQKAQNIRVLSNPSRGKTKTFMFRPICHAECEKTRLFAQSDVQKTRKLDFSSKSIAQKPKNIRVLPNLRRGKTKTFVFRPICHAETAKHSCFIQSDAQNARKLDFSSNPPARNSADKTKPRSPCKGSGADKRRATPCGMPLCYTTIRTLLC